jgi:glutamyl-tRNA reductase
LHGQRLAALAEATSIVEAEVVHALSVIDERDTAGPTIGALVRQAEALRRREVERTLARMPGVDAVTVDRIQQLSRSIVGKLLHAPISHLRDFADDPTVALAMRDAFALDAVPDADSEPGESNLAAS